MGLWQLNISKARSNNYFSQLKGSALYKVGAIASTFLAMPLMIKYLGVEQFGVWATMLTLITWVMLFDLGIGNGLRNKISESLAQDNPKHAAEYISTAYGLIGFVAFILFALFLIASIWIPWQTVFNTQSIAESDLKHAVITLSFFIFFNFWISLVNKIYQGLQKTSVVVLGQFISSALALAFVFLLYRFSSSSIIFIVLAYGAAIVLANMVLTLFVFKSHRELMPKRKRFDKNKINPLLSLGLKFFVIQLAVLVIFMTDKILITQLLGPEFVTPYEVLFKLFSVFTVIHGLILAPLLPAYADAYHRGDLGWIRANMKQQIKLAFPLFVGAFMLAAAGPIIVNLWIGDEVTAPTSLYYLFSAFIVISIWNNIFGTVLGAIGKVRLGAIHTAFSAIINIPLSIFLVIYFDLGVTGIVLSTIISILISAFISPLQVIYFIYHKRESHVLEKILS